MNEHTTGQVSANAAEVYEEFFVPALFRQYAGPLLEAAKVKAGDRVLDVACGTGIVPREALELVGPSGHVTGLDRNPGMLAVARRLAPQVDWVEGRAEALPYGDATFDVVTSQFGLMFFEDQVKALREMWRVLRPTGWISIAVWDRLDTVPGYEAMVGLVERVVGNEAAEALRAPFSLGEMDLLLSLAKKAGIKGARADWWGGNAVFPSLEAWVHTDIRGWTLSGMIDDAQYETLLTEARKALAPFVRADGTVSFAAPVLTLSAQK
jgi:ubiquinone/menaquinone biosynthesis C-methylase UbiE